MALIRTPTNQHIYPLPHLQRLVDDIERATGAKSFGTYIGHQDAPDRAVDIHVPVSPTTLGDSVATFLINNYAKYGIRYIIWRQRIWNEEHGAYWRGMDNRGDNTQNHFDHLHVALYLTAPELDEEDDMGIYDDEDRRKLDQVVADVGHLKTVFDELKTQVGTALRQPDWHQSGVAVNTMIDVLFTMLGDIKKKIGA